MGLSPHDYGLGWLWRDSDYDDKNRKRIEAPIRDRLNARKTPHEKAFVGCRFAAGARFRPRSVS
jgi:hypothetical protein